MIRTVVGKETQRLEDVGQFLCEMLLLHTSILKCFTWRGSDFCQMSFRYSFSGEYIWSHVHRYGGWEPPQGVDSVGNTLARPANCLSARILSNKPH